jgi:hypothetical protein
MLVQKNGTLITQLLVIAVHIMLRDLGQQVPQHDVCHLLLIAV